MDPPTNPHTPNADAPAGSPAAGKIALFVGGRVITELAPGAARAEEDNLVPAILVEINEVTLPAPPARSRASAALTAHELEDHSVSMIAPAGGRR